MNQLGKDKIVLLGAMSKMPVAGIEYLTTQYLVGFERLGYQVYYVEAHACTPGMLMKSADDDSAAAAARYIAKVMERLDMSDRWCFHALHTDGRCYGLSYAALQSLYRSAALIINLHGSTTPLPEHVATGRLVYLGTDPVEVEIQVYHKNQKTIDYLAAHQFFFTWGENYGNPDCKVPVAPAFDFVPTRQPVILDWWKPYGSKQGGPFTTIGNWEQQVRDIRFRGEVYTWSKHYEFLKFLDLPGRTAQCFELALSNCNDEARQMLEKKGWRVASAWNISQDAEVYRRYIAASGGEFTVAKDQNVRLCSGWFSDRSATYLACGRPVVTQETGFSNILPTGAGLFGFLTLDDVLAALDAIRSDYARHSRAAYELARAFFSYDVVLPSMMGEIGI